MQEILDGLKGIGNKIDANKSQVEKEIAELKTAHEKENNELKGEVKKLNETLAAKDATIGDIKNEVNELKAKGGRFKGVESKAVGLRQAILMGIEDGIKERKDQIVKSAEGKGWMDPYSIKTVGNIASANLGTDNYISYLDWQPGMEPTGQFHFRSLVRTILSETDFVQFPRANTPIGEGSFGRQTEAAAKAQVDRDYTMIELTLKPMAAYAIASRQSLRNITFLQSWLPSSLMNQMEESEDTDFANSLVAAATGSTTASGITVAAEKLIFYIKNLIAAKYNPNAIASDPTNWATILVTKPSDYSLPGVVSVDANGTVRVLGRPFYPVNWLTGNRVLVGDFTKAAIVQSEGLTLRQTDSHANTFVSNEVTFLVERSEGLAIFRPDAFITTTL